MVFYLIVGWIALPLDAELLRPGEGELTAAYRLLERVFNNHGRILDGVIGDAEYLSAPFFNLCTEHQKYAAATLKDNNPALLAEAQALAAQIQPVIHETPCGSASYWDIEGIDINPEMKKPLRVLLAIEPPPPLPPTPPSQLEPKNNAWATTAPLSALPSHHFAQLGHRRWDIENRVFNILVNQWGLDHCYKHHPTAILNFILTLFLAYLLVQTFRSRNLKPQLQRLFSTLISLADELRSSLAVATSIAPWVRTQTPRPP